ncbi:DUF2977 domain-containing protein [Listeria monocytogenes]|nr:DUF2977 domain-containing protein [Listeria monocytogenes]HAA4891954.1 hypothetical protein [Listeria monocytogenes]
MIIFFNNDGYIQSYADSGKTEYPDYNQTDLPERLVPENFRSDFKPNLFIYNGNKIIVNELYEEPKPQKEINRLAVLEQLVQLQAKKIMEIETGDKNE